ncbi:helix-turn-helix domain-containing protein [Parvibaculum sp.]|uniref:winged helix-turn-helix transcriptional regulator n=1 Tax=Parvibaculum sp. TaxID=2024848 RepID=UPI00320ED0AB
MTRFAHESSCPVEAMFRVLMGPWTMYILWTLRRDGPLRFGVLKRQLAGVSSKVLTERLRLLESEGLIYREHNPTIPPEVTYGLTENGRELGDALDALEAVARRWDSRGAIAPQPEPPLEHSARTGQS